MPRAGAFANAAHFADPSGQSCQFRRARTLKDSRRLARHRDRRSPSPRWQFLRGFIKNPVMVGSIIPSSRVLIDKMLRPVDWETTRLFVEYGPGVGTFTRPILDRLGPDAKLVTIDTNAEFTSFLRESIDDPRLIPVTGSRRSKKSSPTATPARPITCLRAALFDASAWCRRRHRQATAKVVRTGGASWFTSSAQGARLLDSLFRAGESGFEWIKPCPGTLFWAYREPG